MKINFHITPLENQSEIDRINLLMTNLILLIIHRFYFYFIILDTNVKEWPLMSSPLTTIYLSIA